MNGPSSFGNGAPMLPQEVKEALDRYKSNPRIAPFIKNREAELANLRIETSSETHLDVKKPEDSQKTSNHPPVPETEARRHFSETQEPPELKVVHGPDGKISWERVNE